MKLHADYSQRVVVSSDDLPWVDSPRPGVQRRMLERDGDEVARATSIVRYAPNSHFSAHNHEGGEEIFVLNGVFEDEFSACPQGTWLRLRNPSGSRHTPLSRLGCLIFVKIGHLKAIANSTTASPQLTH